MSLPRPSPVSPLAEAIDLSALWNASDADLATRLHPSYAPALTRLPDGTAVFRGLPFQLGRRAAGPRWIVVDRPVTVTFPRRAGADISHVVVAQFADSWRNERGERPPGTPVGWVVPAGELLASYELLFADGTGHATRIRRRFQIADGIIGWGVLPFEAVGHRADEPLDWRGPYPRQSAARYAPAGQAGLLGMLPASWGPAQTGVADFVPTVDDDISYWLHAIPVPPGRQPVGLRLAPAGDGRPGSTVVLGAVTLFRGTAHPLVLEPRRQLRIEGGPAELPEVDLGVPIRSLPVASAVAVDPGPGAAILGWGRPRTADHGAETPGIDAARIVDLAASRDARLTLGDLTVAIADLDRAGTITERGVVIRALPPTDVRVDLHVRVDGVATPARIRFTAADGRYLAPLGHRDEVNPALLEDTGADILLGSDVYAYVAGDAAIDLPIGAVDVEIVKGLEFRPVRTRLDVTAATGPLTIDLERAIELPPEWRTADPHVHFLAPSSALVQAAAEDVGFVHLLATQAGDLVTNAQDLAWGSLVDPTGRHALVMGTENRQNLLGHLTLLGARRPTLPMASGGAPEGRLGGAVTELLMDWADRCHAADGLVVAAHFPLPYAEIAAAIVTGRIDAVEMQTFAPRLDTPSIAEWYRFLNCGYRLPVLGGTDKMSAEVPVGAIRTYARLDPDAPRTAEAWTAAVRAGRTFATAGPLLTLEVEGHEPGDVIELPSSGGRLEVRARARASQPVIAGLEIVMNGEVVASEIARPDAASLDIATSVDVRSGSWIAARSVSTSEIHSAFATAMAAHTSPVYVEVVDRPLTPADDDVDVVEQVIAGARAWIADLAAVAEPEERARMLGLLDDSLAALRRRTGRMERS